MILHVHANLSHAFIIFVRFDQYIEDMLFVPESPISLATEINIVRAQPYLFPMF